MKDNEIILKERIEAWNNIKTPRVGDFIYLKGEEEPRRFTHKWYDGLQTTLSSSEGGSFYLGYGYMSYSGGLDSIIKKEEIILTQEEMLGDCWFFNNDIWGAGRAKYFKIICRVYKQNR